MNSLSRITHVLLVLLILSNTETGYSKKKSDKGVDKTLTLLSSFKSDCSPCLKDSSKVMLLLSLSENIMPTNYDSAFMFCEDALKLSNKIKWRIGSALSLIQKGTILLTVGDFNQARDCFEDAVKVWETLKKKTKKEKDFQFLSDHYLSIAYGKTGITYYKEKRYNEAINWYVKGLIIAKEIDDHLQSIELRKNLGLTYQSKGQYETAIGYYNSAVEVNNRKTKSNALGEVYFGLATIYSNLGKNNDAIENYKKAEKIVSKSSNKKLLAQIQTKLGDAYKLINYHSKSIGSYKSANKIYKEIDDLTSLALNLKKIGDGYSSYYNPHAGEKYLSKSQTVIGKIATLDSLSQMQLKLSNYYEQKKDYQKAMLYYKELLLTNEQLSDANKTYKNIIHIQEEKEIRAAQEKKEILLNSEIKNQKLISYSVGGGSGVLLISTIFSFIFYKRKRDVEETFKLQVSETEMKALRAQMNPHFIFNALQSIQTFLRTNQARDADYYLLKFAKLMRFVVDNSQEKEIPLEKDLEALKQYMELESLRKPFTFSIDIDEAVDTEEAAIPPLILQPFVENAIKHGLQSKEEMGHIRIKIFMEGEALKCIVEDNGVGRKINMINESSVFCDKKSKGMEITEARLNIYNKANNVNADFKIVDLFDKEKPAGTRIELLLPVAA
jgi:tetratricopeptide (TPR) repeat protein